MPDRMFKRATHRVVTLARQPRRAQMIVAVVGLSALAALLMLSAAGMDQYRENVALNIGADVVGALVTIVLITPIIRRAQNGRIREVSHLNYAWFTEQVSGATRSIRVLDTFSSLLDLDITDRFFRALTKVMGREASVQVLLLDPDSPAVAVRAKELDQAPEHTDVRREIMRNLRALQRFEQLLNTDARRLFEVRLYSASAGVTLYQWDDRALVSFLSIGRLSGQGAQLEVPMSSQVGAFVDQRFAELWRFSRPLNRFLQLRLTLVEADGSQREFSCRYVDVGEVRYVANHEVLGQMARRRRGELGAYCDGDPARPFELDLVDDRDESLYAKLASHFTDKYGDGISPFIHLIPVGAHARSAGAITRIRPNGPLDADQGAGN